MNTSKYLSKCATFSFTEGDKTLVQEHKGCYKIVGTLKLENEENLDRSAYFNLVGDKSNGKYTDYYLLEHFSGYSIIRSCLPIIMTKKELIKRAIHIS
jgi:hypothetical protein